jgi:[protein-PII] uridylyltransferase
VGRRSGRGGGAVLTRVVLDDRASPEHTVVEVFSHDRPGLLFTLANALHGLGLTIDLAKISTEGVRVIDVFYVRDKDGLKVSLEQRSAELRTALLDAVASMDAETEEA